WHQRGRNPARERGQIWQKKSRFQISDDIDETDLAFVNRPADRGLTGYVDGTAIFPFGQEQTGFFEHFANGADAQRPLQGIKLLPTGDMFAPSVISIVVSQLAARKHQGAGCE